MPILVLVPNALAPAGAACSCTSIRACISLSDAWNAGRERSPLYKISSEHCFTMILSEMLSLCAGAGGMAVMASTAFAGLHLASSSLPDNQTDHIQVLLVLNPQSCLVDWGGRRGCTISRFPVPSTLHYRLPASPNSSRFVLCYSLCPPQGSRRTGYDWSASAADGFGSV